MTNELEKTVNNAGEAVYRIKQISQDLDCLNANLQEIVDTLDNSDPKNAYFLQLWMEFPTYSTLNDMKVFLEGVVKGGLDLLKK